MDASRAEQLSLRAYPPDVAITSTATTAALRAATDAETRAILKAGSLLTQLQPVILTAIIHGPTPKLIEEQGIVDVPLVMAQHLARAE